MPRPRAETAGVSIAVDVAGDPPLLEIDPVRIREVLTNLLANALRYAPAGRAVAVAVRTSHDGRVVRVSVEDAGPWASCPRSWRTSLSASPSRRIYAGQGLAWPSRAS